jgi:arsenite methyltransferase
MKMTFDASASARVERLYQTPDIVEQRRASRALLALKPGEQVLDIGCGPGLLMLEMAQEVGALGRVAGVDVSADMLAFARARCEGTANMSAHEASATALPFAGESFDAVAVTQVYEFVEDLAQAFAQLKRVMKSGARALIVDTDWDGVLWRNSDRARMRRVIDAWHLHCPHPHLPTQLPQWISQAGLRLERAATIPIVNTEYHADNYSHGMIATIAKFASGKLGVSAEEAQAWAQDLISFGARGQYYFCLNRCAFLLSKA